MIFLAVYSRLIVHHSYLFLFIAAVIGTILTIIPLVCHELPSFSDPISGFSTRGTKLASRLIAWENLVDEIRPSKRLAVNPQDIADQIHMDQTYGKTQEKSRSGLKHHQNKGKNKLKKKSNKTHKHDANTTNHNHWEYGTNVQFEDENMELLKNHTRKQWVTIQNLDRNEIFIHQNYASGKCGSPSSNYAHLVITTNNNSSLFNYDNILKMCELQTLLLNIGVTEYNSLCERPLENEMDCCPIWSVPNYMALMSGKPSCKNLTQSDVDDAVKILSACAGFFHNFTLMESCDLDQCKVPKYCSQYNAVFNMLFYLIDSDTLALPKLSDTFMKNSMIFLPLPKSSTVMPYYDKLQNWNLTFSNIFVPAIDFGLKNALFDRWLIQDTWLVALGCVFVLLWVFVYSRSLLLTILLFIAISYSIGVAYFLYVYVFNLEFFPFMNLLVIVVVVGIGTDDAFLYIKVWNTVKKSIIKDVIVQNNDIDTNKIMQIGNTINVQLVEETMRHSIVAILMTTLTTAVAFFASYVSYIPAINCFSIFAGTAVLVNFILMVAWLPASVFITDVKLSNIKIKMLDNIFISISEMWEEMGSMCNRFVIICVVKLYYLLFAILGMVGCISIFVVFYHPGLQLPNSREFQLFQSDHPFEQYDVIYKNRFFFEKLPNENGAGVNMPLRWIWGVEAIDNGNHMNPASTGHLVFSKNFSVSDPESQVWLLNFCAKLKAQPFYQPTLGPLLPNCFIESFKSYMRRKCFDFIDRIDRTPCCETSIFPYEPEVFDFCIIKAIESLYQTPRALFLPGVAGPKFLRGKYPPKIAALVVEFESSISYSMSYSSMNNFFEQVDNWTQVQLESATSSMKDGWFISDFQFYDLQKTLASGTIIALMTSASLGFVVLIPGTHSIIISLCSLTAMIFSVTSTISILVLCGWKLNILESVAISTSAGLAVDFSLHYALSFKNATGLSVTRVQSALATSAGPTAAAALTSSFAGLFLLKSNLLPYSQIGTFLALIMCTSWIYATFFLCPMLCILGGENKKSLTPQIECIPSSRGNSPLCSGVINSESHELEHLAKHRLSNNCLHSPSSISAITVVLHDSEGSKSVNQPSLITDEPLD